jgi:hypothetical protein
MRVPPAFVKPAHNVVWGWSFGGVSNTWIIPLPQCSASQFRLTLVGVDVGSPAGEEAAREEEEEEEEEKALPSSVSQLSRRRTTGIPGSTYLREARERGGRRGGEGGDERDE